MSLNRLTSWPSVAQVHVDWQPQLFFLRRLLFGAEGSLTLRRRRRHVVMGRVASVLQVWLLRWLQGACCVAPTCGLSKTIISLTAPPRINGVGGQSPGCVLIMSFHSFAREKKNKKRQHKASPFSFFSWPFFFSIPAQPQLAKKKMTIDNSNQKKEKAREFKYAKSPERDYAHQCAEQWEWTIRNATPADILRSASFRRSSPAPQPLLIGRRGFFRRGTRLARLSAELIRSDAQGSKQDSA